MTKNPRKDFLDAVGSLNDEGFNYVSWQIYQTAKTAGGFTDHEGWERVRQFAEALPYIAETQAKFEEAYKQLDDAPPTQVVPITPEKGGIVGPGGSN